MVCLEITLHSFWAKHAPVKWKLLPRLEPDHGNVADLQLNSALLSAKAAMCFHQLLGRVDRFVVPTAGGVVIQMGPELFFEDLLRDRSLSHSLPLSTSIAREKLTCACRLDTVPANSPLAPTSSS